MNIVYVVADDAGYGDFKFSNPLTDNLTPEIDALAAESCNLSNFHATPVCTSSRVALHAGQYAHRFGMADDVIRHWRPDVFLPLSVTTLADSLKVAGYYTAMIGKWHLGHGALAHFPTNRGFDHFEGNVNGALNYTTHEWPDTVLGERDWFNGITPVNEVGYVTTLIGDKSVDLIAAHDFATPLFLNVNFTAPHLPLQALAADEALFPGLTGNDKIYAAMMYSLDRETGRIVQALKDAGQWENTLFVFTSDNGGEETSAPGDNGTLRGEKDQLYNGGVLTSCLVRWPGMNLPSTSNALTHIIDLHRTACIVAGVPNVPSDGENMGPLLAGVHSRPLMLVHCDEHSVAFINGPASAQGSAAQQAWRSPPDMKFIVNPQRLYEGSIPTAIEAYATSDRNEVTDISGAQDLMQVEAMITDLYAQRVTPQSRRTDENLSATYVPPVNWLPLT